MEANEITCQVRGVLGVLPDLLVGQQVIVVIKSVEALNEVHFKKWSCYDIIIWKSIFD